MYNIQIIGKDKAEKELIPIEKLKDFLLWRQKEFIEKYEGTRYNTENDIYKDKYWQSFNRFKPTIE